VAEPGVLLDASAFLALILDEPGAEAVLAVLDQAAIGAVNLSEVQEVAIRRGHSAARAGAWAAELGLPVLPFTAPMAAEAAVLLAGWRRQGLSLGDCACLGVARHAGLPVLTADHAWAGLEIGVTIRLIR
jgi:PIN domain nuclease of toxin-antitoxin system